MLDIETFLKSEGKKPYTGRELTKEERDNKEEPYCPSERLKYAVNLAILIGNRPLLLKGEPGSGKTRLAKAVANELGWEFRFWDIKSTTIARDGLYRYDAVKRLQDAQLAGSSVPHIREAAIARLDTSEKFAQSSKDKSGQEKGNAYLQYGPLGEAFASTDKPVVVLIDEIDKADIDFPNDLLRELDQGILRIEEIGKEYKAKHRPLIFVTSNDEKDLPDAFLRRCLFHYIEFPQPDELKKIVKLHQPQSDEDVIDLSVERFCQLRSKLKDKGKKISTAELLDWYSVLVLDPDKDAVLRELDPNSKNPIPYPEVLLKRLEDWRLLDS